MAVVSAGIEPLFNGFRRTHWSFFERDKRFIRRRRAIIRDRQKSSKDLSGLGWGIDLDDGSVEARAGIELRSVPDATGG